MNEQIKKEIFDEIKDYDKIIITRHLRPDGDAVGSSQGLKKVLKDTFPKKKIYLINEDYSDYLSFFPEEDAAKAESFYYDALMIVLDTGTESRISNRKYSCADKIIKIDHHICEAPYGDLCWIDENRASVSEMVAEFCLENENLKMSKEAAEYFYCGIVTDTGRFHYVDDGTSLRVASSLIDYRFDVEKLYARLYLEEYSEILFRGDMYSQIQTTENGVAYLYITDAIQKKYNLTREQASDTVSLMEKIKGSIIWMAFIDNGDGSIRVRLRSRFVPVQPLASRYHGGGHEKASGATVYSKQEMDLLIAEADVIIKDYKENNEGWL